MIRLAAAALAAGMTCLPATGHADQWLAYARGLAAQQQQQQIAALAQDPRAVGMYRHALQTGQFQGSFAQFAQHYIASGGFTAEGMARMGAHNNDLTRRRIEHERRMTGEIEARGRENARVMDEFYHSGSRINGAWQDTIAGNQVVMDPSTGRQTVVRNQPSGFQQDQEGNLYAMDNNGNWWMQPAGGGQPVRLQGNQWRR
jgi:hypothetical protein